MTRIPVHVRTYFSLSAYADSSIMFPLHEQSVWKPYMTDTFREFILSDRWSNLKLWKRDSKLAQKQFAKSQWRISKMWDLLQICFALIGQ